METNDEDEFACITVDFPNIKIFSFSRATCRVAIENQSWINSNILKLQKCVVKVKIVCNHDASLSLTSPNKKHNKLVHRPKYRKKEITVKLQRQL